MGWQVEGGHVELLASLRVVHDTEGRQQGKRITLVYSLANPWYCRLSLPAVCRKTISWLPSPDCS